MSFRISDALRYGILELKDLDRSILHTELLLGSLLQKERVELHLRGDEILDDEKFLIYKSYIDRLKKNEPLEYLIEKVSFYGYEWKIRQGVLIPRPETEILVEKTLDLIKKKKIKRVFEFGVGSGIISITLALSNPSLQIVASDINPLAIALAQENLELFAQKTPLLKKQIRFIECDVLHSQEIFKNNAFELLVSNPPYIALGYELPSNVAYEPKDALFGGEGGEEILKALIALVDKYRIPYIACEMGFDQKKKMQDALLGFEVEFYQDLSGLDRGFIALRSMT